MDTKGRVGLSLQLHGAESGRGYWVTDITAKSQANSSMALQPLPCSGFCILAHHLKPKVYLWQVQGLSGLPMQFC